MDIKQLEYIITIAQEHNLMKASEKCFITQPALSHFITKLEMDLGYQLFFRERNNWTLTPVGEIFVDGAKKILNIQHETFCQIDEYLKLPTKEIHIGVGTGRGSRLFRKAIPIFQKDFPNTKLIVFERRGPQIREMLKNGEVDLAVCTWNRHSDSREEILFSIAEPLLLAAPKGKALPCFYKKPDDAFPTVELKHLTSEPFIFYSTSTSMHQPIEQLIKAADFTPVISLELENAASIIQYVSHGVGLSFVQKSYSNTYKEQVDFYYISPSVDIDFCIACRKDVLLPSSSRTLVHILRHLIIDSHEADLGI